MVQSSDVIHLVDEYKTLVAEAALNGDEGEAMSRLKNSLANTAEWTPASAEALTELAQKYGVFMLRNALALAIALEIEDGSLGY